MVTRREYWREEPDSIEAKILGCASFDAVAPVAVYMYADSDYEKEAVDGFKKLKNDCKNISELKKITTMDVKRGKLSGIDVGHIYNRLYEMIAEDYGEIAVDYYGAWGHIDRCGKGHYGDSQSFFPFYTDEETLKKHLDEWDRCESR